MICEGVRGLVAELRQMGFKTIDSGDGSHFKAGMGCAVPDRHVVVEVPKGLLIERAQHLSGIYPKAKIEASWSPGEPAVIVIWPDGTPTDYQP